MRNKLGELLVKENMISDKDLSSVLSEHEKSGERLGSLLIKAGQISEDDLTRVLSDRYGYEAISLDNFQIQEEVIGIIKTDYARKKFVVPIMRSGNTLIVSMVDPTDFGTVEDLKFMTGHDIQLTICTESQMHEALDRYYPEEKGYSGEALLDGINIDGIDIDDEAISDSDDAPVVKLVNRILSDSFQKGASDIHFEPYEKNYRLRYRIDGQLNEIVELSLNLRDAISSRLKILSNLDIAERRLPQDGRIKLELEDNMEMEYRVSVLPTMFGEKVVLRLLDKSNLQLDMTKLGFNETALARLQEVLHQPYGMILVTGPTGSGKTTTLYSALSEINQPSTNISTAEDPVEFSIEGINQVQVNDEIGLSFAAALRSFLRQDPDVIMVGEIRDYETAEISVKASLTGHMVLSTLHTNDAPSTIYRLLHMGVEPFLVASAVSMVIAQRLARKICPKCKEEVDVPKSVLLKLGFSEDELKDLKVYSGKGCGTCNQTGYKGRIALYEVLALNQELRDAILAGASSNEIKSIAIKSGMQTLRMAGLEKIKMGLTTVEEVEAASIGD